MKKFGDFVYFLYVGNNKSHAFRNYKDVRSGKEQGYIIGYDKFNQPILESWIFDFGNRRIVRVHPEETDKEGKKAVDFLRNAPECAGSPNGYYVDGQQIGVYFKEINEAKDAVIAVSAREKVIKAQSEALKLSGQDLEDMAAIIGVFDEQKRDEIYTHRVLDYAANFPDKFFEYLNDPSRKILSLVRKALNAGVFVKDGKLIKWEDRLVGADESEAVSNILKDDKLRKGIELNLSKL
jgi:hypothetical protein